MEHVSTILIVDDDAFERKLVEGLLSSEGYNLAFAATGAEALPLAAKVLPDLVLLDVMMPDMNGYEVCRCLRADSVLAEVPIIMVTILDDSDSRLKGFEAGADDFVTKPFDRSELLVRIRTVTRLDRFRHLLYEQKKFELVVEQADEGYLIVNGDDRILYLNTRAREYLDLPTDDGPPISQTLLALAQNYYNLEPQTEWENWPDFKNGSRYFIRPKSLNSTALCLQVDLLEIPFQTRDNFFVRLRDVTEGIEEQFIKWTFHSHIAHKLRTPLTNLSCAFELLNSWFESDTLYMDRETKKLLLSANEGVSRLRDEVDEIFQYIRAPDIVKLGHHRCSILEIKEIIKTIEADLSLQQIKVSTTGIKDIENTFAGISYNAIKSIILELCENAMKFHPHHSPSLEIVINVISKGIRFQVCDDGQTLSPAQLIKLWTPYYQAESKFTGQVKGMGLGLSTIALLVWYIGGSCRAFNRQDGPGLVMEIVLTEIKT